MNINFPHHYLEETESTNIVALELLSKTKPPNGFLIITDYQTAGKGQYGRIWQSERAKNILCSLIFGPLNLEVNELFKLHLATSLALIRNLKKWKLTNLSIKWPNDIFVGSKKLAGILIQNQLKGSIVEWSVIGMGINVNQTDFPVELNATSIERETGYQHDRVDLVSNLRSQISDLISIADEREWDLLLNEYNSKLYLKDQLVSIITKEGNQFEGKIIGVTYEGRLCILNNNNQQLYYLFGEVQYNKKL